MNANREEEGQQQESGANAPAAPAPRAPQGGHTP
jgi:hypothetical protein